MKLSSSKVFLIITPIYCGGGSGASVYYKSLVNSLRRLDFEVTVVTDKEPCDLKEDLVQIFPTWASREKSVKSYVSYALQNLVYFKLFNIIKQKQPSYILIHTAFLNHPGLFSIVFKLLKAFFPNINFVADVRDRDLPIRKIHILNEFDKVIACSLNVKSFLEENGVKPNKVIHIPIIQEKLQIGGLEVKVLINELNLTGCKYLLYIGLVKEEKNVDLLLEAFVKYVAPVFPNLKFVVAGILKSQKPKMLALLKHENVLALGNVNRRQVLALISDSLLCVGISPIEGLPRSSLEPLTLGVPTLLPPFVPEFELYCPKKVVNTTNLQEIGEKIIKNIGKLSVCHYPVEQHSEEHVVAQYLDLFNSFKK